MKLPSQSRYGTFPSLPKVLSCPITIIPPQASTLIFYHCVHFLEFYMKGLLQDILCVFFFFSFGLASVIQPSAFETHRVVTCIRSFYLFITDWLCCCTACNFLHKMSREQQNHTEIQMPGTSCIHLTHGACDLNSALNIIIYFHKS